ncbi:ABC transporter permease [Oceanirhabdus sp. W0125-5]|uniref:ABC transporter permease n=1 Tax=Oceanirhabdus sp. W0125-5 TaxID=2999116 RepID=UPI0022F2A977|nr:ABC transporter permease [Oceanirhabdus sp. W0125-5]WBW96443.1 ABC transporter permease [Oceanirhabdus sp. W0125-5]
MIFSLKRFNAVLIKEFQDFKSNINYLVICLIPLFLSIIYKMLYSTHQNLLLVTTTIMSISMIGLTFSAGTFSEEKEKHTLRVVMLSPISELELFLGKALLSYILIIISSFANLFILNPGNINGPKFLIVVSLAGFSCILFGIGIGILAPNEKTSGILSLPVIFIYLIPVIFTDSDNVLIRKIVSIFPAHNIVSILIPEIVSKNANSILFNILNLVMWIAIGLIFFIVIYRKKNRRY